MPTPAAPRVISLGRDHPAQREYRVVSARTLAQDVWMTRVIRVAGLDQVTVPKEAADDPVVFGAFITALVQRVFDADVVGDLLAGVLVPLKAPAWNAATAEATKTYLLGLTDEDEKRVLLSMLAEILSGFLSGGRNS